MTLLIIECIPKQDRGRQNKAREGMILFRFLTLPGTENLDIKLREFQNKKDIIKFLNREKNVEDYEFVHLSGAWVRRTISKSQGRGWKSWRSVTSRSRPRRF